MNKWMVGCLSLVGLAAYVGVYLLFKWMGFDTVQAALLVLALATSLVGLAFYTLGRIEGA